MTVSEVSLDWTLKTYAPDPVVPSTVNVKVYGTCTDPLIGVMTSVEVSPEPGTISCGENVHVIVPVLHICTLRVTFGNPMENEPGTRVALTTNVAPLP
jgi:hypothetical protein